MNLIFNPFRRIKVSEKVRDDLHQAELDLHNARASKEYWDAMVPMLENRVRRMQRELEDDDVAGNVTRLNQRKGVTL